MDGTIKRLVAAKGFGFIRAANGTEYFFHRSSVVTPSSYDDLQEGQRVEFDEGRGEKGPRAERVHGAAE